MPDMMRAMMPDMISRLVSNMYAFVVLFQLLLIIVGQEVLIFRKDLDRGLNISRPSLAWPDRYFHAGALSLSVY